MKIHPLVRLLGQKVAAVERNRPYRVRDRIFEFAPLPSAARERKLVVLCEPRTFSDGCWSAWSWLRFVHPHLHLHLFVDGPISDPQREAFTRLFPGAALSSLPEFVAENLRPSPALARFLEHYKYARKLSLLATLQAGGDFLYSDADVVAFRRPDLILNTLEGPANHGLFMEEPGCYCVDPWVAETATKLNLPRHNDLNSGLLWIVQNSLDLEIMERILALWSPDFKHTVTEQTIMSVLMAANGSQPLPPEDYLLSNDGMFFWQKDPTDYEHIVARHYVGNVRHLLYRAGLPRLLPTARRATGEPMLARR